MSWANNRTRHQHNTNIASITVQYGGTTQNLSPGASCDISGGSATISFSYKVKGHECTCDPYGFTWPSDYGDIYYGLGELSDASKWIYLNLSQSIIFTLFLSNFNVPENNIIEFQNNCDYDYDYCMGGPWFRGNPDSLPSSEHL